MRRLITVEIDEDSLDELVRDNLIDSMHNAQALGDHKAFKYLRKAAKHYTEHNAWKQMKKAGKV